MYRIIISAIAFIIIFVNPGISVARGLGTACASDGSHIVNEYIWRVGLMQDLDHNWPSIFIATYNSGRHGKYYTTTGAYGTNNGYFETLYSFLSSNRLDPEILSLCISDQDKYRFIGLTHNY